MSLHSGNPGQNLVGSLLINDKFLHALVGLAPNFLEIINRVAMCPIKLQIHQLLQSESFLIFIDRNIHSIHTTYTTWH